jgi:rhodanese-related sulfurtransferase
MPSRPIALLSEEQVAIHQTLPSPSSAILEDMLASEITPQAFAQQRQQPNAPLLLDVREPWEYQSASLPNSLLMPMGEVASRAHQELDPDAPIVVLCHHGARSLSVTMWLRNQGFEHAQSLAGGIDAWSRTIDPTVPRY